VDIDNKAKAVATIVVGCGLAHRLGLLHGHLTGNNIRFDWDDCIQIVDFNPIVMKVVESESESKSKREEVTQLDGFSGEGWTPEKDIQAFASILFELVFGCPPQGEISIPTSILDFVSRIIESGLSPISGTSYTFNDLLKILKQNNLKIDDDVDSVEVSAFVNWVESAEHPDE
jgi:hypothetical protein